jgi:hypothetical protein
VAEVLIYIKGHNRKDGDTGHWMDDTGVFDTLKNRINGDIAKTLTQKAESLAELQRKYDARSQYGDIVEVRPDGYWGEPDEKNKHGWDHAAYALVKIPKITIEQVSRYRDSVQEITGTGDKIKAKVLKKWRYNISALGLTAGETRTITKLNDLVRQLTDKA